MLQNSHKCLVALVTTVSEIAGTSRNQRKKAEMTRTKCISGLDFNKARNKTLDYYGMELEKVNKSQ